MRLTSIHFYFLLHMKQLLDLICHDLDIELLLTPGSEFKSGFSELVNVPFFFPSSVLTSSSIWNLLIPF